MTVDLKRLPKRTNNYNVVLSNNPTTPNSIAIDEDGSDYSYFSAFYFGSKGQKMYMLIDTGSANTWVMAESCTSSACQVHNTFGPDDSTTLNMTTSTWSITYGTGSVSGVVASDTVAFASFNVQLGFGMATQASDDFNNYPMDGILGLGRAASSDINTPPVINTLSSKGLISQKLIGVHLQRGSDNLKDGELTFGGVDTTKFSGSLNYVTTVNANGWEVVADDAIVNGKACNFKGKTAIIDTGTSYILMPPADAAALHNLIPGSTQSNEQFTVPCSATAVVQFSLGGVPYTVSPKDYIGRTSSGSSCFSNIIGHQAYGPNQWILGDTFLKNVYAAFDFDGGRIGFATQTNNTTSSSSSAPSASSSSSSAASSPFLSGGSTSSISSSSATTTSSASSSGIKSGSSSSTAAVTSGTGTSGSPFGSGTSGPLSSLRGHQTTIILAMTSFLLMVMGVI